MQRASAQQQSGKRRSRKHTAADKKWSCSIWKACFFPRAIPNLLPSSSSKHETTGLVPGCASGSPGTFSGELFDLLLLLPLSLDSSHSSPTDLFAPQLKSLRYMIQAVPHAASIFHFHTHEKKLLTSATVVLYTLVPTTSVQQHSSIRRASIPSKAFQKASLGSGTLFDAELVRFLNIIFYCSRHHKTAVLSCCTTAVLLSVCTGTIIRKLLPSIRSKYEVLRTYRSTGQ